MNRLISLFILAAPLALVACGKQPTVDARNASVAEVAEKARDAVKMQAGEWAMKGEVIEMTMPGMNDPKLAQMMKDQLAKQKAVEFTNCITPEQAERPSARMFAGDGAANCKYEHFTMGGGKVDAALVCGAAGPDDVARHMRQTISGSFTSTSIDVVTEAGGENMKMKMRLTGKRIGDCKPGAGKAG